MRHINWCEYSLKQLLLVNMTKWLKQVRALPSDPVTNDVLKIEYIDVNLNNSRKLIANIQGLATASKEATSRTEDGIESMLRLRNVRHELSWLDNVIAEE